MTTKTESTAEGQAFKIKTATIPIVGTSPLSFGRHHEESKHGENESHDQYERRTFPEKTHYDHTTGEVYVPPLMFKKSLEVAPAFLNLGTIPGKGSSTYTKFFLSALMITDPVYIGQKISDGRDEVLFVNPMGKRNSGTRVKRWFKTFDEWAGILKVTILNSDIVTEKIFERVLIASGIFVGVGRFRPQNGGFYGRFKPNGEIIYEDLAI